MLTTFIPLITFIAYVVVAYRITTTVIAESTLFKEFNQGRMLAFAAPLFPVGPVVLHTLSHGYGWLPAVFAAALCYLPTLFVAREHIAVFSRSGTDRTQKALDASYSAFWGAIAGLIYIGLWLLLVVVVNSAFENS